MLQTPNIDCEKVKYYQLYFDLEATGLSKWNDNIVQIGAQIVYNSKVVSEFDQLIRSDRTMSTKASQITGITDTMLKHAPDAKTGITSFFDWVRKSCPEPESHVTMIAYNGFGYDYPLFFNNCHKNKIPILCNFAACRIFAFADPLQWCRRHVDKTKLKRLASGNCSFKQGDLFESIFHKSLKNAHRALDDANGLRQICEASLCSNMLNLLKVVKENKKEEKRPAVEEIHRYFIQQTSDIYSQFNKLKQSICESKSKSRRNRVRTFDMIRNNKQQIKQTIKQNKKIKLN